MLFQRTVRAITTASPAAAVRVVPPLLRSECPTHLGPRWDGPSGPAQLRTPPTRAGVPASQGSSEQPVGVTVQSH
jgi:hypothetical protein